MRDELERECEVLLVRLAWHQADPAKRSLDPPALPCGTLGVNDTREDALMLMAAAAEAKSVPPAAGAGETRL
jgi:hypothetical protein